MTEVLPRQACVFFTHLFDCTIDTRYRKLKTDLGDRATPFILAERGTPVPDSLVGETLFFDFDEVRSRTSLAIGTTLVPGNAHFVALEFYRRNPEFDYYWFVEYDVEFSGNWSFLFDALKSEPADLLAGHIRSFEQEPEWPWWKSLKLPGCELPLSERLHAFIPIYRISKKGLQALEECVKMGWCGHFEGLIPCVIRSASLSISDIGGTGSWTPPHRRRRFYSSFSSGSGRFLTAGTFRYRPAHYLPRLRRNALFHPVKGHVDVREAAKVFLLLRHSWRRYLIHCVVSSYETLASFREPWRSRN